MRYDVYFHDDFDGRASAAVILAFLKSRGDSAGRFVPVAYDIKPRWEKLRFRRPTAIVDFYYHPDAAIWFDHHPTTFVNPKWKREFRQTKLLRFDPQYASCCHLALDHFAKYSGFRPPMHLLELAKCLDVIDSARYRSARQAMEKKEPAFQVGAYVDWHADGAPLADIIRRLSAEPLAEIARLPKVRHALAAVRRREKKLLAFYRAHLELHGRLAYIDLTRTKGELRFAPYYLHPRLRYQLALKPGKKMLHIGLGVNPWRRGENRIHIGAFLRKRFGGGGHHDVGGAEFRSRVDAERAVKEIIETFGGK